MYNVSLPLTLPINPIFIIIILSSEDIADLSNSEIHEIYENMVEMKYNNYMTFYTDGSKNDTDAAAAFVMDSCRGNGD